MNKTTIIILIALLGINIFFGIFQNCNSKLQYKVVNELIKANEKRLKLVLDEVEKELKEDNIYIFSNQSNIKEYIKWIGIQEIKLQEQIEELKKYKEVTNNFKSNLEYFKP